MKDYTILSKETLHTSNAWVGCHWTHFLSAFTSADRVQRVFNKATADHKTWLVFPEYEYVHSEYPSDAYAPGPCGEVEYVNSLFDKLAPDFRRDTLCVDITGFIRPYLLYLLRFLHDVHMHEFDIIYSEPMRYAQRELTRFSDEEVIEVRQIPGYEGTHIPDIGSDLLVLGAGYDHQLIAQVAEHKEHARKIQLFGFPSLRPDMYQENVLRARRAESAVGAECEKVFAPAYDPFVTAQVLSETVERAAKRNKVSNLYLSPLATKAQVLGFGLYYITERINSAASIIFPYCRSYSQETSTGIARVWKYSIQFL